MEKAVTLLFLLNDEIPTPGIHDTKNFIENTILIVDSEHGTLKSFNLRQLKPIIEFLLKENPLITEDDYSKTLKLLNERFGEKTIFQILDGNCKVIGIMSTPGGYGGYAKQLKSFFNYLNSKGAITKLFVYQHAASAGIIIASAFQEIYCLDKTEFMFHRGSTPKKLDIKIKNLDGLDQEDQSKGSELSEMREHLDCFFSKCFKEFAEESEQLKQLCLHNKDFDTYYSGEHLLKIGVVKGILPTPELLTEKIEEELHIKLNPKKVLFKLIKQLEMLYYKINQDGIFSKNNSPYINKDLH